MSADFYLKLHGFLGSNYIALFAALKFFPIAIQMMYMASESDMTPEAIRATEGVYSMLGLIVGPSYFLAQKGENIAAVDLACVQRAVLIPVITASYLLGHDPYPGQMFFIMMIIFDVMGGFFEACMAPGGIMGIYNRFYNQYVRDKGALTREGWTGLCTGVIYMIASVVLPECEPLSLVSAFIGCFATSMTLAGFGCDNSTNPSDVAIFRIFSLAGLLYTSEVMGFNTTVHRVQAVAMAAGLVSTQLGLIVKSVGAFYLYVAMTSYLETVEDGLFYFVLATGLFPMICSFIWVFLWYDQYTPKQQGFIRRIHWQDWSMGVFLIVLAPALKKAEYLDTPMGMYLAKFLAPLSLNFFCLYSKFLIHINIGAPFHPTWWVDSDFPMQAPVERDYINVLYGVITAHATIILVLFTGATLHFCIGFQSLAMDEPDMWKFMVMHGFGMVSYSGLWMIFASSGLPPMGRAKKWRYFPPPTDMAFVQADPKSCIGPHKFDLSFGLFFAFLGGFIFANFNGLDEGQEYLARVAVFITWAYSLAWKVVVHWKDWGYVPAHKPNPYEEYKRLDAEAAAKKKA